jgi:hypothetical protein
MSIPQPSYPPGYNPYSLDPSQILAAMQNNALTTNIYDSTNRTIGVVNDTQRLLTQEIAGVNKNIYDTIAANGIAIERTSANGMATTERVNAQLATAVERNGSNTRETVERVNSQLATAVERNGANGMNTTERTAGQVSSAVERTGGQVGSAIERNGGNIMTAIERVAGEGRLTTTITDAASRQASNDSARDILAAVERNGGASVGASKDAYNGLLASIERNSGENRMTTITADGASQARLADVRRDITQNLNAMEGEVLATFNKGHGDLITAIGNTAWETRQNQNAHYAALLSENQKTGAASALQNAQYYASLLLENQKSDALITKQNDNQFAAMISKTDNHFSTLLLEQQKVKECLAAQAAQNFAVNQLEQQKIRESLSLQLQEAKYEALKHKNDLSKEMGDCCCEIKQKVDQRTQDVINTVDTLDRNRLRDEINTTNNEKNLLKFMEFGPWGNLGGGFGGYGGYGGYGRGGRHSRDRR